MSPWRRRSVAVSGICKVIVWSPSEEAEVAESARTSRPRSRAANVGSRSIGVGAVRSASNGSGIGGILLFRVGTTERCPGAHKQRFGGMSRSFENVGDFRDRQVVEI